MQPQRSAAYKPALFYFCLVCLFWIALLLYAGGFTTTIRAGMAFLDWPLSNGSINPEGWTTQSDMRAEHSHRLLGMKIGLLSLILWGWTWLREANPTVRMLTRCLVLIVILQGVLGGARVRFDAMNTQAESNLLAQSFAVIHACGAMLVLGLLVAITVFCSKHWIEARGQTAPIAPTIVRKLSYWAVAVLFIQILIGAIMRHAEAGMAIARFPLANADSLLPSYWNFDVGIHFAHRVGAVVVLVALGAFLWSAWRDPRTRNLLAFGIVSVLILLALQIYLGALTIWTVRNTYVATIHHLVGAFLLASTWSLSLLANTPSKPD